MNRLFFYVFCVMLYTSSNYAQYTNTINSNRPGDTETPFSVGTRVLQVENTTLYKNLTTKNDTYGFDSFSNDINIQYGFLSERLQANINHIFTHGSINNSNDDVTGTEDLSIGLKYLIYKHVNKEKPALKRSWKRRYGFKYNGLIPSIAIAAKYHSTLSDSLFVNGNIDSYSFSLITQNDINNRLRVNNQVDFKNYMGNYEEIRYSVSSSYILTKRLSAYLQYQYHHFDSFNYSSLGVGIPFLITQNFAIAAYYNNSFSNKISGYDASINLSYRLDNHKDKWKRKPKSKKEKKQKSEDDKTLIKKTVKKKRSKNQFLTEEDNDSNTNQNPIGRRAKKEREETVEPTYTLEPSTEKLYSEYTKEELKSLDKDEKKRLKKLEKERKKQEKALEKLEAKALKAEAKAEKKRLKEEEESLIYDSFEDEENEDNNSLLDNNDSEEGLSKKELKAEKKRLKAEAKAEKKRLKAEAKAEKKRLKEEEEEEEENIIFSY